MELEENKSDSDYAHIELATNASSYLCQTILLVVTRNVFPLSTKVYFNISLRVNSQKYIYYSTTCCCIWILQIVLPVLPLIALLSDITMYFVSPFINFSL